MRALALPFWLLAVCATRASAGACCGVSRVRRRQSALTLHMRRAASCPWSASSEVKAQPLQQVDLTGAKPRCRPHCEAELTARTTPRRRAQSCLASRAASMRRTTHSSPQRAAYTHRCLAGARARTGWHAQLAACRQTEHAVPRAAAGATRRAPSSCRRTPRAPTSACICSTWVRPPVQCRAAVCWRLSSRRSRQGQTPRPRCRSPASSGALSCFCKQQLRCAQLTWPHLSSFVFVLDGGVEVLAGEAQHALLADDFAYFPPATAHSCVCSRRRQFACTQTCACSGALLDANRLGPTLRPRAACRPRMAPRC
jgi:hypothetical protein